MKDRTQEIVEQNTGNKYKDLEILQKLKENGSITEIEFEVEQQKNIRIGEIWGNMNR